jgi:hypothetical protein
MKCIEDVLKADRDNDLRSDISANYEKLRGI